MVRWILVDHLKVVVVAELNPSGNLLRFVGLEVIAGTNWFSWSNFDYF